jgi:adenylosuccinate lyase
VTFAHVAEAVSMGLAAYVGRKPAQDISYQACRNSVDTARPLLDIADEPIRGETTAEELKKLCDPMRDSGSAQQMLDDDQKHGSGRM